MLCNESYIFIYVFLQIVVKWLMFDFLWGMGGWPIPRSHLSGHQFLHVKEPEVPNGNIGVVCSTNGPMAGKFFSLEASTQQYVLKVVRKNILFGFVR